MQNIQKYYDVLSINNNPNTEDIVECAIAQIPIDRIQKFRQAEQRISSRYDRYITHIWSISDIARMHSAGITPETAEFFGKKIDCKRDILSELLIMPGFLSLAQFLEQNKQTLRIGKNTFELKNHESSMSFIR